MNTKGRCVRRHSRPSLMQAHASLLFAGMSLAMLALARMLLPREWSSVEASPLWDGLYGAMLLIQSVSLTDTIKRSVRANRLRLNAPTIAQVIFTLLAVCAGLLFTDDLTLLTGACLQRLGLDVSRSIASSVPDQPYLYCAKVLFASVLPAFGMGCFFYGAQMAAWERRGTKYALWTVSLFAALLCGSVVQLPSGLVIALAMGYIAAYTGSLFLAVFLRMCISIAGIAARYIQTHVGMEAARFGRLWAELGGVRGMPLLALETLLLGLVFFCMVWATCCTKPAKASAWRERPDAIKPMNPADVFVLATAIATGLMILLADFMQMAGIF